MTNQILSGLPYLTLLGCAGIVANVVLSFEEPHGGMLVVSGPVLAAAPIGMGLHLALTTELGPEHRRKWIAGLMSRRGPELFAAYFDSSTRHRATQQFASEAPGAEPGNGK